MKFPTSHSVCRTRSNSAVNFIWTACWRHHVIHWHICMDLSDVICTIDTTPHLIVAYRKTLNGDNPAQSQWNKSQLNNKNIHRTSSTVKLHKGIGNDQ